MVPNLWRCTPGALDVVGAPIQPVALLMLLAAWTTVLALRREFVARLLGRVLSALAFTALALACIVFITGLAFQIGGGNPTPWIEILQWAGSVVAWGLVVLAIRRAKRDGPKEREHPGVPSPTLFDLLSVLLKQAAVVTAHLAVVALAWALPLHLGFRIGIVIAILLVLGLLTVDVWWARRRALAREYEVSRRQRGLGRRAALILLVVGVLFWWLAEPLIPTHQTVSVIAWPYRGVRYLFDYVSAPIATDECLAERVVRYEANASGGQQLGDALGRKIATLPADAAREVLGERGESAIPGLVRVLERVLRNADADEQSVALPFLRYVAHRAGVQPVLRDWSTSPNARSGKDDARRWLACLEKGRRHFIYRDHVDQSCEQKNLGGAP